MGWSLLVLRASGTVAAGSPTPVKASNLGAWRGLLLSRDGIYRLPAMMIKISTGAKNPQKTCPKLHGEKSGGLADA